jgi:hypothetical protein
MAQTAAEHTATVAQAWQWASRFATLAVLLEKHFSRAEPR